MHALPMQPVVTPADRLGLTLFLAIAVHALIILGVTFVPRDAAHVQRNTLDVVLVQRSQDLAPEDTDFLAQANQDGGGDADATQRPATPLPTPFAAPRAEIAAAALPRSLERPLMRFEPARPATSKEVADEAAPPRPTPRPLLAQRTVPATQKVSSRPQAKTTPSLRRPAAPKPVTVAEAKAEPPPPPPAAPVDAAALVGRSLAMASLTAELEQRLAAYAKRPRRKWITARTREHRFAAYMEAWRSKVERIGNLNYPDEARRQQLSGNLLLDVALNKDGSINEIVLRRSSGKKVLDDAAIRIVKLAAPYAKFPKSIAEDVDVLHIERTWRFLSSNEFSGN